MGRDKKGRVRCAVNTHPKCQVTGVTRDKRYLVQVLGWTMDKKTGAVACPECSKMIDALQPKPPAVPS